MKKMVTDQNTCIGCGTCVALCGSCFQLDEKTGKAKVAMENCQDCDLNEVVDSCPVGAIKIQEKGN